MPAECCACEMGHYQRSEMGFQESMMHWWLGRKRPEDLESMMSQMMDKMGPEGTAKMMGGMMPQMMDKMGPERMAKMMGDMMPRMMQRMGSQGMPKMMGDMMPRMMESMGHEGTEHMMLNMMPVMMDNCFSQMDKERREFMLTHCRGMLDQMEAKYVAPRVT